MRASRRKSGRLHSSTTSIHILDNDSLLNIFHHCRPNIFHENQDHENHVIHNGAWAHESWWYKLVQVCRRWRHLIFESASHLHLCLICTHGTPIADMLANFPPFPLVIALDNANEELTTKDEVEIMLALRQCDRVLSVHLEIPTPSVQRLLTAMDDEFPMLEYMHIAPLTKPKTPLIVPPKFEAQHLRHLVLYRFASPIGLPFFTTAVHLVTLILRWIQPPPYHSPDNLHETLSHLPRLEILQIGFHSPVPKRNIQRIPSHKPVITLPHLRWFSFAGVSAHLEALLPHMATPLLRTFKVHFFNQLSYSVPRLQQFLIIAENLRFYSARFLFHGRGVAAWVFPPSETTAFTFYIHVPCEHLDWRVSSMAQIFNVLDPAFSTVVDLTLDYTEHGSPSEERNEADGTLWRKLLGSFRNLKTLRVHKGLIEELSGSLPSGEDRQPLELLPELTELHFPAGSRGDQTFIPFMLERQFVGRPINLISSAFPVGLASYVVQSPAGVSHIRPDHVDLP